MSLSGSLSNAMSGLAATSRGAQIVASNLANALDENYGRRELNLTSLHTSYSGGVRTDGITRHVDPVLLADRRSAAAGLAVATHTADSLEELSRLIGTPEDAGSINGRLRQLETALGFLESDPAAPTRLSDVVNAGTGLVDEFRSAQDGISQIRARADAQINASVQDLNTHLHQLEKLNADIVSASVNGRDTSGQLDRRQVVIDAVNTLIPVREMPRAHGAVALVSTNGMVLLDGRAAEFDFTPSHTIMPHMSVQNGMLGRVQSEDLEFDMTTDTSPIAGGSLQGLFKTRDETTVAAQSGIDGLAMVLATRFQDLGADSTTGPGAAGLFTDAGARADPASVTGLAGRLQLHAGVDPAQGGAVWRLRSGLNALVQNAPGDARLVTQMQQTMTERAPPLSAQFSANASLIGHAASVQSNIASSALMADRELSFAAAEHEQLLQMQRADGVDTDAELQRLLTIETNYAANAKVIQTIDDMLSTLMRIG